MDLTTTKTLSLDFYNNEIQIIRAKQYDKKSRFLLVKCTDKGIPYLLDKTTMKCNFKMSTPDGRGIYNTATIQEDGTVLVELTETALLEAGMCDAELDVIDFENESLLSTMCFNILIEASAYSNDTITKSDEFNALTKMVTEEQSRYESMTELEETVSANEEVRIANENTRIGNENNRVSAENERITDTATAITNANNATTNANNATANAETATEAAQEATNNANIATQQANTVIETMRSLIADDNLVHVSDKGIANGVATLDENGNIPSSQLPSYVDDVLDGTYDSENDQFLDLDDNVYTPESGKIYIDITKKITYRWSGSTYVDIGSSLALGTTSSTAFPGDRGLTLEEKVAIIEAYHNNIPASDIKFDNTNTPLLGANVQTALEDLTKTATQSRDGLLSAADKALIDNYANIQEIEVTLYASQWVGDSAPYTQILALSDLISYNNCSIELSHNATVKQETAITDANISDISYDESTGLTFTASGEKPTVDIPIIICVGSSMNVVEVPTYLGNINKASAISYDNTVTKLNVNNVQDAIDEIETNFHNEMYENLIPYPYYQGTVTKNGITFTDNGDGTVTANGTATATADYYLQYYKTTTFTVPAGKYTMSGCPEGCSESTFFQILGRIKDGTAKRVLTNTETQTIEFSEDAEIYSILRVVKGATVENITFKPMLEYGSIAHAYKPYSLSNMGLQKQIDNISNTLGSDTLATTAQTCTGAINELNTGLTNKYNELNSSLDGKAPKSHASTGTGYGVGSGSNYGHCKTVDNLDQSKYVNGVSLSAHQGYVLKQLIDTLNGIGTIGSAFRFYGTSSENYTYGCYGQGIYTIVGTETGIPEANYPGYMLTLRHSNAHIVKIAFLANSHVHVMGQGTDGTVASNWRRLAIAGVDC